MGLLYESDAATDVTLTTTAETVLATVSGVASQRIGQKVRLHGHANITLGTGTTALVFRIREDSLTGTLVDELETDQIATAAGSTEDHEIVMEHAPAGELSNKSYVLTVSQTGASANGTCNHANLKAETTP